MTREHLLFEGKLAIFYGQAYVVSGQASQPDLDEAFYGQRNGLCGAAAIRSLFLVTGTEYGHVDFRVELRSSRPSELDQWEEVVEVGPYIASDPTQLASWAFENVHDLDVPTGAYRVWYCARGMDRTAAPNGGEALDEYALLFYPSSGLLGDKILKHTSSVAGYWHRRVIVP